MRDGWFGLGWLEIENWVAKEKGFVCMALYGLMY
jgi:hypothetical protein